MTTAAVLTLTGCQHPAPDSPFETPAPEGTILYDTGAAETEFIDRRPPIAEPASPDGDCKAPPGYVDDPSRPPPPAPIRVEK